MKNRVWTAALVVACGLVSLGFGSCGGDSTGNGGPADGGVIPDSAARSDVAAVPDSANSPDEGVEDTAVPQEGGDEAYSCGEPYTDLGGKCDDCIETNCEPVWCACATDPLDAGDAGTGCLHYVKCVEECVAQDAGSPTDCLGTICATAPSTASEQQAGHAYLDCMIQYCATNCGQ